MANSDHNFNNVTALEQQRLQKLYSYDILDTPDEYNFDKIAKLAAQIFESPIAQITFVDQERVFFKSNISPLTAKEIDRNDSFCNVAIKSADITVFEDMLLDESVAKNKFVQMENGVRFYAGAPLKTIEGLRLGTICVLDIIAKKPSKQQLQMLETLSSIVMDELNMRLATRAALRTQTDMMHRIVHDLKNPNTTITLSAELIKRKADDPVIVLNFADRIKSAASRVLDSLNNLLQFSTVENLTFRLNLEEFDINEPLIIATKNYELLANEKNQTININGSENIRIIADKKRLQEAFENLISNALKYAYENTTLNINVSHDAENLTIEFKDEGQGLTTADIPLLFGKFTKLSAVPTGKEYSNGLGLSIVKMLIELHKGKIWAESEGQGKGASFFVAIPFN